MIITLLSEVNRDRIAVEVDTPSFRLFCHSSDINRGRGLNVLSSDREVGWNLWGFLPHFFPQHSGSAA